MKKSSIWICSKIADILHDMGLTNISCICNKCELYFPDIKIIIIYENVNPFEKISRKASIYYFSIDDKNNEEFICEEEWEYKFIFLSSPEEESISKIYDQFGNLLAYKYYDNNMKYQFYVGQKKSNSILSITTQNCSFEELQESIKQMEIKKLENSIPYECSQRKSETIIIIHAYNIYGKQKNCYILPINNNRQIYGGNLNYFHSSKFQKIDENQLNHEFIVDLNLNKQKTQKISFVVLPIKLNHHFSILLISLKDEKIYLLDSKYNDKNYYFGRFQFIPLIKYEIQLYSTCAYFMEAMCIVLSQYENVSNIIDDCNNGIFIVKTFVQIGIMFQRDDERTVIYPYQNIDCYQKIEICNGSNLFTYGLKNELSDQKFFNFLIALKFIDPKSQFIDESNEIKKLEMEINDNNNRILNILNVFHKRIDIKVNEKMQFIRIDQSCRRDFKHQIQLIQNEYQLENKGTFQSIMCLNDSFKKQKSRVLESVNKSQNDLQNEIE